jgi:K+-sensing histidine kinase KdpD
MEKRDAPAGGDEGPRPDPDQRADYLGFVAHEVRNPLSTALWSAELLSRMTEVERGGARGEKLTAMCLRSLGRVRQLVEDHLLCERLDARGIPLRPEAIPLRELLEQISGRRAPDLAAPALQVAAELVVEADRTLLERALEALLAVAARDGAAVRVEARHQGDRITIGVAGAFLGESPLEDPKKGAQGDARGRALALPLVRRIAETLGGSLTLAGDGLALSVPARRRFAGAGDPGGHPSSPA